jgi:hypothetical protein
LIELARDKVFKQIKEIGDTPLGAKDFALPVYMKSMTEKIDHTTQGEKIIVEDRIKNLTAYLNDIHRGRSQSGDGTFTDTLDTEARDKE